MVAGRFAGSLGPTANRIHERFLPGSRFAMNDKTALLRAIAGHPDEDTPRLAYADWLQENGHTARASFIRGQIEYARLPDDSRQRRAVAFRCRQLLDAHEEDWLEPRDAFSFDWNWSRGFVETFVTAPPDLEMQDAALFHTNPFRRLWVWELEGSTDGLELVPPDNRLLALDLIGNKLNANQLKKLAKMTHFPHLRELGLMFNDLRDSAVRVLCGEPFFQRLALIRLGANPFSDRARDQLRAHFGERITFAHDRDPQRLYALKDERVRVGHGSDFTQFYLHAGEFEQQLAVFDHAGTLLRTEERAVHHAAGADYHRREMNREAVRDKWLEELGYRSATIRVKRFRFDDGRGIYPFNWWADVFDGREEAQTNVHEAMERWLVDGQFRLGYPTQGIDMWLDRSGEVTDT
jgi:uncharacterized protein (TIGR02996 family)